MVRTVFLDRDGVINKRYPGYISRLEDFELLPGAVRAIVCLVEAGWRVVIVTNQRGLFTGETALPELNRIHAYLQSEVASAGGRLDEIYYCPHDRSGPCSCRKPKPGLLDQAHRFKSVDWNGSWLVGDSDSDIQAAKARGVRSIKIGDEGQSNPDFVAETLTDAVSLIVQMDRDVSA